MFPGHTELLAHLTGTDEVSMMLSTPKVKVIHVTTHIGLLDAIEKIEPGLVERTIRRGHEALDRPASPTRIGVCAINPHAGEGGLFGRGEEEAKIAPAIARPRADGIDAHGPLPADTAFFLAGRGDYDLIVAMYHDQGHGPVKVLGIEAGVNITVGLPVIRTSVDHGTAFDIAGQGVADRAQHDRGAAPGRRAGDPAQRRRYGIRTRLMTWITPLDAAMSGVVTRALSRKTFEPRTRTSTRAPLTVLIDDRLTTFLAVSLPGATW